jgi:SSS family solute:Na+ symporter
MAWEPYVYQYSIGGIIFFVGLFFGWRVGFVGLQSGAPRRNLFMILAGLAFFMGLQGYLQFEAPTHHHETAPALNCSEGLNPLWTGSEWTCGTPAVVPETPGTPLDYGVMIAYFLAILAIGSYFGRHSKTTKDFFFGGQRFSWWFITMSLIATTIGSYSFVKYSRVAYTYGISSSQTYMNDWFWLPLFLFGWLPIIFFSKVVSIPEYFDRRFGPGARGAVTALLLVYLVGYIGVNLFTMGTALHHLIGWEVFPAAVLVACISAIYVTAGGQTSVIVTDLFQGFMLLAAGAVLVILGINSLGGGEEFWAFLKPEHRMAFPNFNSDPSYSSVGIFWQDAVANSAVFFFLNQGVMMRFLSVKNVNEGKKAAIASMLILMPIAAVVVASGGWVGSAMQSAGQISPDTDPGKVFFDVSAILCQPGVFGLIMAALTAALMSTVDTLITAVAAIVVNDVWRPYVRPNRPDRYYLGIARKSSVMITILGVLLVPLFMGFDSIYSAHGAFTAAVTPPLVVALVFAMLWPRFTPKAAVATVLGGFAMVLVSVFIPELVAPFSQGIPNETADGTVLEYAKAYKFTRAFYGLAVSATIGIVVTMFTKPKPAEEIEGLTQSTVRKLIEKQTGADVNPYRKAKKIKAQVADTEQDVFDEASGQPIVQLSQSALDKLQLKPGDSILVSDRRWWFGGLRSCYAQIADATGEGQDEVIILGPEIKVRVAKGKGRMVVIEAAL